MKLSFLLVPIAIAVGATAAPDNAGLRKQVTFDEIKANFAQPDMLYAPFMFWFWDAPIDKAQAVEVAQKLAAQRINPGYAHARHSIATGAPSLPVEDWLSPLWFDALSDVVNVAEKSGTYFSFCDEYWWPSGRAGGKVLEAHPELRAVSLKWNTFDLAPGQALELPASFFTVAAQHAAAWDANASALAAGPQLGTWIWASARAGEKQSVWFRKSFALPEDAKVKSARIKIAVDDEYLLYCNDEFIGEGNNWKLPDEFELIAAVKPGRNVISIEAFNAEGNAGLIAGLVVELENGQLGRTLGTGADWLASDTYTVGWNFPDFDDSAWKPATVIGGPEAEPWKLGEHGARHVKATIKSSTLSVIGAGEPFTWTSPADGYWRVYSFNTYESTGVDNSDVNYLDNRLADAFIKIAYEPYLEHFRDKLGNRMSGVFMDNEGDYGYKLAWSDHLEAYYKQKTGRDIRLWMPLMIDDDSEGVYAKARYDWFDCVSDIYARFFSTVNQWCTDHGLYLTGHLWEESLMLEAVAVGDVFQAQRAFSMPGTDCLEQKALDPHDFKEARSVAEFEGRRLASEILGVAGWDMTPVLMKKALNSVTAWGVSHVIPHGLFMTRNFDGNYWPPDWYDENPYFRYLHQWSDFARRASYVNACGQYQPQVLLYHPMDSIWALSADGMFDPSEYGGVNEVGRWFGEMAHHIDAVYTAAINSFTEQGVDFLIADDEYLRKITVEGDKLLLNGYTFMCIMLPPVTVMPLDVAAKLVECAEKRPVFAMGELPTGSTDNGMNDPQMTVLMVQLRQAEKFRSAQDRLERGPFFESFTPAVELFQGEFPLLQRHIQIDGRDFFWLANNTSDYQNCEAQIDGIVGAACIWDCETGQIGPVEVQTSEERQLTAKDAQSRPLHVTRRRTRLRLSFKPYEAYWLVIDPQAQLTPEQIEKAKEFDEMGVLQVAKENNESTAAVEVAGPWRVSIDAADQPRLPNPVEIPDELKAGVEKPLEDWKALGIDTFSGYVDYSATFEFNGDTAGTRLDLGNVMHMAEVWLNGQPLGAKLWPPYVWDVAEVIKPGSNSIKIKVGNLIDKNLGGKSQSGLFGPVRVTYKKPRESAVAVPGGAPPKLRPYTGPPVDKKATAEEALKAWKGRVKASDSLGRRKLAPKRREP
ncbi:MAG: glycosyl hydrolase [Candidatus Hydrogenedentes bacterium]|nr:glycosyl hydrolase [Candidatus Hydrogenedentota bacterium]